MSSLPEFQESVGTEAAKLYNDATALLTQILAEKRFTVRGTHQYFPANSVGDDIEVYADAARQNVAYKFHTLRQQMPKKDSPNYALADFIAPKETKRPDHLGAFCVAVHGADEFADEFKAALDDYNGIMVKAIADRLAEAGAEYMHKQAREVCGFGLTENLSPEELIREKYRGIRPAPGYPAQPDHTEKLTLFTMLDATARTGCTLTESMAMHPGSSVSGLYFNHPQAKYFGVGQISEDQITDYALRKGMDKKEVERWLGPWLGY